MASTDTTSSYTYAHDARPGTVRITNRFAIRNNAFAGDDFYKRTTLESTKVKWFISRNFEMD